VSTKLLGLQYKIIYRPGHSNRVADALSRRISPEFNAVSEVVPQWLTDVQKSYRHDPAAQSLMARLALDP
jgi:predicted RNA-binding protein